MILQKMQLAILLDIGKALRGWISNDLVNYREMRIEFVLLVTSMLFNR